MPAAGAENFQAPCQPADFMTKLGHLTRVPARCAAQHLQHLVQLAASAASSERRQPAKPHQLVSLTRSALGAERKRGRRNACREVQGRLSCKIEATDRSAAD